MQRLLIDTKTKNPVTRERYIQILQVLLKEGYTYEDLCKVLGLKLRRVLKLCEIYGLKKSARWHKILDEQQAVWVRNLCGFSLEN